MSSVSAMLRSTRVMGLGLCAVVLLFAQAHAQADPLPSWHEGPAKRAILDFVTVTTDQASPDYVPPEARIVTFDNDGTLWAEQPLYVQFVFALERVKVLAPQHPEWQDQEPFASLLKGDVKAALAGGAKAMEEIVMATHAGMTTRPGSHCAMASPHWCVCRS